MVLTNFGLNWEMLCVQHHTMQLVHCSWHGAFIIWSSSGGNITQYIDNDRVFWVLSLLRSSTEKSWSLSRSSTVKFWFLSGSLTLKFWSLSWSSTVKFWSLTVKFWYLYPYVSRPTLTQRHTPFKLSGEINHVRSNWQSNLGIRRSKVKVTEGGNVEIIFGAYQTSGVDPTVYDDNKDDSLQCRLDRNVTVDV